MEAGVATRNSEPDPRQTMQFAEDTSDQMAIDTSTAPVIWDQDARPSTVPKRGEEGASSANESPRDLKSRNTRGVVTLTPRSVGDTRTRSPIVVDDLLTRQTRSWIQ